MKKTTLARRRSASAASILLTAMLASNAAHATTKADNTNDLNLGSSWAGGVAPGTSDVALWNNTVLNGNTTASLGGNLSWKGISIVDPGAAVTISSGNTLTLGTSGIDMSAATQDLTISSGLTLGAGNQVWNVASGRTLALNTGTFTRTAGATMNIQGAGTASSTMTGLTSAAQTNGILTWATVGTGTNTRFATFSGDNLVGYTGATAASTASGTWDGIPSGDTGTTNYDITVGGTGAVTGNARIVNSIRYSGTGAFTQASNTNGTVLMTTNAILNAGTGTFTIGTTGGTTLNVGIGSTNELVLNAANAGIVIANVISGAAGAKVTVVGPNTVTLNGASTFSGGVTVNSGTLAIGASSNTVGGGVLTAGSLGTGAVTLGGGVLEIGNGATQQVVLNNIVVSSGTTSTINNSGSTINRIGITGSGLTVAQTVTGSGTLVLSGANNISLRDLNWSGFTGTVRVDSATLFASNAISSSTMDLSGATLNMNGGTWTTSNAGGAIQTIKIGALTGTSTLTSDTAAAIYEIGNLGVNSTFSGTILAGTTGTSVKKVGTGTLTLSGANTYAGATTVSAGTLSVSSLANGGSNSNIGASANTADKLILDGGTLQYTGAAVSTNRLFSLQSSSTIDASGSGAVNFTNTGAMGFNTGTAAKTLTLTGTNTGANTLAAVIGDNTGATSVTKSGAGSWTLTGANTYTGATTVTVGTLATGSTGTFGAGNVSVVAGAALTFGNNTSIADLSTLFFAKNATAGSINLSFTGVETVGLVFDSASSTYLDGGTYTASELNTLLASMGGNAVFTGTGSLSFASAIPEPATYAALAGVLALGAVITRRRSR